MPRRKAAPPSRLVASRVRALRVEQGWSQGQLADRMKKLGGGIHQTAIGKIEAGTRRVTIDEWLTLAVALDASPLALLAHDEKDVVELAHQTVTAPELWAWITMRSSLPFQDADAFTEAHEWALPFSEREQRELLREWTCRLTAFLDEHGEISDSVRGGFRAQLHNAVADIPLPGRPIRPTQLHKALARSASQRRRPDGRH